MALRTRKLYICTVFSAAKDVIARTYFYMADRYKLRLSKQDRQLFTAWSKTYPPQPWELARNQRVACVMGHGNAYVGSVDLAHCP